MRILHVLGGLNRGGAESWLVQILRHIDRRKYQFDFLVHTDQPCAYDNEVRSLGARIIPCLSLSKPAEYTRNFFRILREMGPYDCIHSHVHRFSGYILTLARLAGVPVRVAHSHTADKESDNRHFYPFVMSILMDIGATAGLGVSEKATRALFGENWKVDPRWRVSHLGIDLEPFCCPVDSRSIRAEFGIPEHAIVVGHVGGFVPMKNHSFILEVAQQVCAANPEALFVFVGDGPLRKAMEIKAENLGIARHTRFIGVRNDVVRILKGLIDLFLFPSLYEGFPVALMEAQAAGLRCFVADTISTEIDICPELITRLSLADGAYRWAESILKAQCVVQPTFHPDRMHYFSIEVAARRLCSVYDQQ